MVSDISLKVIEKTSRLNDIVQGEKVIIKGIINDNQRDELVILHADNQAGLILAERYLPNDDVVEHYSYFVTPYGVKKESKSPHKFGKGTKQYEIYKNKVGAQR